MKRKNDTQDNQPIQCIKKQKNSLQCPYQSEEYKTKNPIIKKNCTNNNGKGFSTPGTLREHILNFHKACPWCKDDNTQTGQDVTLLAHHITQEHQLKILYCSCCDDYIVTPKQTKPFVNHVKQCSFDKKNSPQKKIYLKRSIPIPILPKPSHCINNNNRICDIDTSTIQNTLDLINIHQVDKNNYNDSISQQSNELTLMQGNLANNTTPQTILSCHICCIYDTDNQYDLEKHIQNCSPSNLEFEILTLNDSDFSDDSQDFNQARIHQDIAQKLSLDSTYNISYPLDDLFDGINQDLEKNLTTSNFVANNTNNSTEQDQKNILKKQQSKPIIKNKKLNKKNKRYDCPLVNQDNCKNNNQKSYGRHNVLYDHILRDHNVCPFSQKCTIIERFTSKKKLHKHMQKYHDTYNSNYCEVCDYLSIDKTGNFRRHINGAECIRRRQAIESDYFYK